MELKDEDYQLAATLRKRKGHIVERKLFLKKYLYNAFIDINTKGGEISKLSVHYRAKNGLKKLKK